MEFFPAQNQWVFSQVISHINLIQETAIRKKALPSPYELNDLNLILILNGRSIPFFSAHDSAIDFHCNSLFAYSQMLQELAHGLHGRNRPHFSIYFEDHSFQAHNSVSSYGKSSAAFSCSGPGLHRDVPLIKGPRNDQKALDTPQAVL
jgi:hypothetical protein